MDTDIHSKRLHIRHPTDIPIHWSFGDVVVHDTEYLRNISQSGLAFVSHSPIPEGAVIDIQIPIREPEVKMRGVVMWCRGNADATFDVGVQFEDPQSHFQMRMVEQVCHIEQFKKAVREREGRQLTGEQAALEWIRRYAADFPQ